MADASSIQPRHAPEPQSAGPGPSASAPKFPRERRNLFAWLGLAGPIFSREVRSGGRRTSTYVMRCLYVMVMLGLVTLVYFAATADLRSSTNGNQGVGLWDGAAAALQGSQIIAPSLALAIMWLQFIVISLLSPTLTGGAICEERQKGTLATLLCTPLNVRQIVLGKLGGSTVQISVLALASLPVLLSIRVFGGVRADTVLWAVAVTMSHAVLGAALGLLFSISNKRATAAMSMGVFLLGAVNAQPLLLLLTAFVGGGPGPSGTMWDLSLSSSSVMCMLRLTGDLVGEGFPVLSSWPIWSTCIINLILAMIVSAIAMLRLRRLMIKVGAGTAEVAKSSGRKKSPTRAKSAPLPPSPAMEIALPATAPSATMAGDAVSTLPIPTDMDHSVERETSRQVGDAPIAWRELRQPFMPSRVHRAVVILAMVLLLLFTYFAAGYGVNVSYATAVLNGITEQAPHMIILFIFPVIALFVAMVQSTGGIGGERDARTWEVLITSPLSAWQIILGKWLGAARRSMVIPLLLATYLLLMGTIAPRMLGGGGLSFAALPLYLMILVPPVGFMCATGVLMSLFCRRSVHAAVLNSVLGLSIWLVFPLTATLFHEIFRVFGPSSWINGVVWGWNPLVLLGTTVGSLWDRNFSSVTYRGGPWTGALNSIELVAIIIATALAYTLLTIGTLLLCVRGFNRLAPRVS